MRLSKRLASGLALVVLAATPSVASANPFQKGPEPTISSVRATAGPYELNRAVYSDAATPGFGPGAVFWPKAAPGEKFGVVAFAPGFTETSAAVSWLAQRVASYGFVTIAFNVNSTFTDLPDNRGRQLLAALLFASNTSAARTFADGSRQAAAGHSMGGGGALFAGVFRPSLKATVGLTPWNPSAAFGGLTVPTLQIGAQLDIIAPVALHALPFYRVIPSSTPKTYAELRRADHFATNRPTAAVGAATVSWLKTYVDNDTRYAKFICGSGGRLGLSPTELSGFQSNC